MGAHAGNDRDYRVFFYSRMFAVVIEDQVLNTGRFRKLLNPSEPRRFLG